MADTDDPGSARAGFFASGADALRLRQLARVTVELGAAETMGDVAVAAVNHVASAIGAAVATLMLRDGDQLILAAGHGLQAGVAEQWHSFPVSDANPASEAVRTGRPIAVAELAEIRQRYPRMVERLPAGRSIVCLPLGSGGTQVGVLGLTFEQGWLPGPVELDFLTTFADTCGQAIRRVRAAEQARIAADQLTFLAEASAELASSLDYRSTLTNVAQLTVPRLADWCAVEVLQDGVPRTLAVAHVDPIKVRWAWELQERYPTDPAAPTGSALVLRTGVSELYTEITDDMLVAGARDGDHLALTRELNLRSAMVVPLTARGHTLGAITLIRAENGPAYGPSDLSLAEELGRRAGLAMDNATLYGQAQDVALQLQRAVLPSSLDGIEGWEIATHYAPGGRAEVGGDFYDAVRLPDGRLAVAIGDVMGHGVQAAAAMAQMRAAIRAYLSIDPRPSEVVANLDSMFAMLDISGLVTLVYAILDPSAERMVLVNAGHYPPLVVAADGQQRSIAAPSQRPLGAGGDERTETSWPLCAGDTLLLYTDGLIERRGEMIDIGLRRLADSIGILARSPLGTRLADLVRHLERDLTEDDVTAFAVRQSIRR